MDLRSGAAALALLDTSWDGLLAPDGRTSPSLASAWLRPIAEEALAAGREPVVAGVRDGGGRPRAGIALSVDTVGRGCARLRLGSWLGHPRRVYQPDILMREGEDAAAAEVLAAILDEVHGLVLHDTPAGGAAVRAAAAGAPWAHVSPGRPSLVLGGDEPSLRRRRRQAAYEVRRARSRGAEVSVSVSSAPDEVAEGLEILFDLHRRRWEGRVDVSGFSRAEADRRLHRHALPAAARAGMVRMTVVREAGRPVAALVGLMGSGAGMLYRTATVPGPVLKGPGVLALLGTIDAMLAGGALAVDLGIGSEMHKRKLGPRPVPSAILLVARSRRGQPLLTAAVEGRRRVRDGRRAARRRVAGWRARAARGSASDP